MIPVAGSNTNPVGNGRFIAILPTTPLITGIKSAFVIPGKNKSTPVYTGFICTPSIGSGYVM